MTKFYHISPSRATNRTKKSIQAPRAYSGTCADVSLTIGAKDAGVFAAGRVFGATKFSVRGVLRRIVFAHAVFAGHIAKIFVTPTDIPAATGI